MSSIDPDQIKLASDPTKMKPTGNQVVVELEPFVEKSAGGLFLPTDSRMHEHRVGTVIAVGPGKIAYKTGVRCPMDLKVGDKVLLGRYIGADFQYNNKTYRIMPEEQIYCAIE